MSPISNQVKTTIDKLAALNLTSYPVDEAISLINEIGKFGGVSVTLHKEHRLTRARPNGRGEIFRCRDSLSFKPSKYNTTFQRASTPNMTMFYGVLIPENANPNEVRDPRVTCTFESLPWIRDKSKKGLQKITYSIWEVIEDIHLIAIVQNRDFSSKMLYLNELYEAFNSFIKNYPEELESTLYVTDFFAKEFSKDVKEHHCNYILSALFTELVVKMGFDGVLYPSMRLSGDGINVAITPKAADRCLKLTTVTEGLIYKHFEHTTIDNLTLNNQIVDESCFDVFKETEHHAGVKSCLESIGVGTIDDLY